MKAIIFVLSLVFLSSCGLIHLAEEMKDEVKGTREEVEKTNTEVKETNRKLSVLESEMILTNSGVHLQTLDHALKSMLSPEATDLLAPPLKMMPYGFGFGKKATATELIAEFHTLYTEALRGYERNEGGNLRVRQRTIALTAAEVLAGLAPEEKARAILTEQIEVGGKYQASAGAFGRCRFVFVSQWLLDPYIQEEYKTPVNVETLRVTTEYLSSMYYLAKLPYVDAFQVEIPHLGSGGETLVDQVNPKQVKIKAKVALRKFSRESSPQMEKPEAKPLLEQLQFFASN